MEYSYEQVEEVASKHAKKEVLSVDYNTDEMMYVVNFVDGTSDLYADYDVALLLKK